MATSEATDLGNVVLAAERIELELQIKTSAELLFDSGRDIND